eukprot:837171-Pyramimonas_sp.AAC.1
MRLVFVRCVECLDALPSYFARSFVITNHAWVRVELEYVRHVWPRGAHANDGLTSAVDAKSRCVCSGFADVVHVLNGLRCM